MGLLEKQIYPDIKRQTQQTLGAPHTPSPLPASSDNVNPHAVGGRAGQKPGTFRCQVEPDLPPSGILTGTEKQIPFWWSPVAWPLLRAAKSTPKGFIYGWSLRDSRIVRNVPMKIYLFHN
jgi:hypothetical protein